MSNSESNVDPPSPSPIYPTLTTTTNSNSPNILTSSPSSYVSLLDSSEAPGSIIFILLIKY